MSKDSNLFHSRIVNLLLLFSACLLVVLLTACGSKRNPTGGKVDLVKPVILATVPEEFGEIKDQTIEISFSKPIDRTSFTKGLYIYPPIANKKIYYDANIITIRILEALQKDTNYNISLTRQIKDLRGNPLDANQTLVLRSGKLNQNRISGNVTHEDTKDQDLPMNVLLLDADSLLVMTKTFTGSTYSLETLNPAAYILRAYIDKNLNNRYDYGREPYFETTAPQQPLFNIDIHLAYADTVKPVIRSVRPVSEREYEINLSKNITSYRKILIQTLDGKKQLPVQLASLSGNSITVLTAPSDTTRWQFNLYDASDAKGNTNLLSNVIINGTNRKDTAPPTVVSTVPRSGASVNDLQPVLEVTFSEIIPSQNLFVSLSEMETGKAIPLKILSASHKTYRFQPENLLTNYRSCQLLISEKTSDVSGNTMKEAYKLIFLPIYRQSK